MKVRTVRRRKTARKGVVGFLRSLYRKSILRPYLHLAGLVLLRRGRLPEAENCLCRAALIDPHHFNTRVHLGRVYFLMEEFFKAEQQFLKAQEIDPRRFHRNHLPNDYTCWEELEANEDPSRAVFGDYEAQGALYSFEESAFEESAFEESAHDREGSSRRGDPDDFHHGDFSSYAEWQRFQSLPPIQRSEIQNIDWDQIFSDPAA